MKLRNKQTGEVDDFIFEVITDRIDLYRRVGSSDTKNIWHYNSIAELNEEWEDYKEPLEPYWFLNDLDGKPMKCDPRNCGKFDFIEWRERRKKIGNYFETKEEAEKAVEKLKAWKRLKDNGFTIRQWQHIPDMNLTTGNFIAIRGFIPEVMKNIDDLDLLFGGEE